MNVFEGMETVVREVSGKLGDFLVTAIGILVPIAVITFAWFVLAAVGIWAWRVIF